MSNDILTNSAGLTHGVGGTNQTKPEWLSIHEACRIFALSRSGLYLLMGSGEIRSVSLKKRGAIRGRRLISYDSLVAFFEKQASASQGGLK